MRSLVVPIIVQCHLLSVPRQVSRCPGLLPCRLTPRSRQWTALVKLTLFFVM